MNCPKCGTEGYKIEAYTRVDELRAFGNAVLPATAKKAFLMLWSKAGIRW